jgi:N-acetylmuramoyl-L-alanine amidase
MKHTIIQAIFLVLTITLFKSGVVVASAWPRMQNRVSDKPPPQQSQNPKTTPTKKGPVAEDLADAEISEARRLLDRLGYWVSLEATGNDISLHHAITAFQKVEGRERTGILTREELEVLRSARMPQPLESEYPHVEIDLDQQVLLVIDGMGAAPRILSISSGSGELFTEGGWTRRAITPTGRFEIYRKIEGWRKSPLGLLYYPNYIYAGIAIHGNPLVPPYPASHGCIRIPMFAAKEFSAIAKMGMVVIVYDINPLTETERRSPSSVRGKSAELQLSLLTSQRIEPQGGPNDQSPQHRNFSFWSRDNNGSDLFTRPLPVSGVPVGNEFARDRKTDTRVAFGCEGDPRAPGGDSRAGMAGSLHRLFAALGIGWKYSFQILQRGALPPGGHL